MKKFNWLIKLIFYKHKEHQASVKNTKDDANGIFYNVGFIDQMHANLCNAACQNMLYHFGKKPIASMNKNPLPINIGFKSNKANFTFKRLSPNNIREQLNSGPFILALPLDYGVFHSIVVIGYANDEIIYHDPLTGGNRKMSINDLSALNGNKPFTVDIPNFLSPELLANKSTGLKDPPEIIAIKKYQKFFTLDKMSEEEQQCQAILGFLKDYVDNSFFTWRTHKGKVKDFLEENKDETDLQTLLTNMITDLSPAADRTQGELEQRLETVYEICGTSRNTPQL